MQAVAMMVGCQSGEQVAEQVLLLQAECFEQFGFGIVAGTAHAGMNAPADSGDFGDACAAVVRVEAAHDQPVCFQPVQQ